MTVEEIRGSSGGEIDNFPVGMRVLAVDDDPTCLMLLDGLLRKCLYQVTTTGQARIALKMLRENRNRFDVVISDVYMPDMDGFKLLELVGLEMDLPVIMLSANSDPKLVMKGITHGACDYLVKPVRIEELRNIWQHVIRKKKLDPKCENKSINKDNQGNEGVQHPSLTGNADQNGKLNRKRKDEEEDGEENGDEDEDPATQKKPRVVWSIDLHRKFVAAVNQLGIEKAVPKRILDLMNVEGLTRENVASHLQKYRLYLKRISNAASEQANMVAALGGKDSSHFRIGSFDGFGDFRTLAGPGRLTNTALSSYPASGMLGRLNSPSGMGLHNLASSNSLIQPSRAQSLSNSINVLGKFQPVLSPANQDTRIFQGIPSSLELDQLQQSKFSSRIGDLNPIDDSRILTTGTIFTDTRITHGSSNNSLTSVTSNPLMMLQGNPQNGGGFTNQSSLKLASFSLDSFSIDANDSNLLDNGRCSENWNSAIPLSNFPSNSSPLSENTNHDQSHPNGMRYNNPSAGPHTQNNPLDFLSNTAACAVLDNSRPECQEGLVGDIVQNINQIPNQLFGQHKPEYTHSSNNAFSRLNSQSQVHPNCVMGLSSQSMDQNGRAYSRRAEISLVDRSIGDASTLLQHSELEKSTMDLKMRSNEGYLLEQTKSQGGVVPHGYDSLDDLMNAMMKQEQLEGTALMNGEFGLDAAYSFGSCL